MGPILEAYSISSKESLNLLPEVRLKSLFFYLLYTIVLTVTLLVVVINSYYLGICILEQDWILNLIGKTLVVVVTQNTLS